MNTIRFSKNLIGFGAMLALAIGFTTTSFAGPSPQFWTQQAMNHPKHLKKAEPAKPADVPAMACAACKTTDIRKFYPGGAGGKVPARYDVVGTKHECGMCGGAITVVQGVTTNAMQSNCPTCAKATPNCCTMTVAAN